MKKVTRNKDGSIRKSGSGRKKGATSFCDVTLLELEKHLPLALRSETLVKVSRVWWEKIKELKNVK